MIVMCFSYQVFGEKRWFLRPYAEAIFSTLHPHTWFMDMEGRGTTSANAAAAAAAAAGEGEGGTES
eukprot:COSAG05_NODE_12400_length_469_cov_1.124324_2_plen_65_part_01